MNLRRVPTLKTETFNTKPIAFFQDSASGAIVGYSHSEKVPPSRDFADLDSFKTVEIC